MGNAIKIPGGGAVSFDNFTLKELFSRSSTTSVRRFSWTADKDYGAVLVVLIEKALGAGRISLKKNGSNVDNKYIVGRLNRDTGAGGAGFNNTTYILPIKKGETLTAYGSYGHSDWNGTAFVETAGGIYSIIE